MIIVDRSTTYEGPYTIDTTTVKNGDQYETTAKVFYGNGDPVHTTPTIIESPSIFSEAKRLATEWARGNS